MKVMIIVFGKSANTFKIFLSMFIKILRTKFHPKLETKISSTYMTIVDIHISKIEWHLSTYLCP
jgi:hypothetical protein